MLPKTSHSFTQNKYEPFSCIRNWNKEKEREFEEVEADSEEEKGGHMGGNEPEEEPKN